MTPERTEAEQHAAADGDGRLRAEHDLDEAALEQTLPAAEHPASAQDPLPGPEEAAAAERPAPSEAPTDPLPAAPAPALPSSGGWGLRRRTRILLGLLVGGLLFLAGIQCQKLTAGGPGPPGPPAGAPRDATSTAPPGGPSPRVVSGEIVALRGSVLYVREADGDVVRLEAGGASRVFRGAPADLGGVRPGEMVVAELQPGGGEPAAISLTVLPSRLRGP